MIGRGTLINCLGIIVGGVFGLLFGKLLKERHQESLQIACGISTIFIGISGAMEGMLEINDMSLVAKGSMMLTLCLTIGTLIGEIINIENGFTRFGEWLKVKTGNSKDREFVNGFVTASLTVCIGAMAIIGSIEDGMTGDYSILATKAILDFVIIMVMTCSMGKGCIFSAIPVLVLEGGMTIVASFLKPIMSDLALAYISLVGSVLIFCVGLNLVWGKKVRVANMLPAIILAILAAFI